MKRLLWIAIIAVVLTAVLASCGALASANTEKGSDTDENGANGELYAQVSGGEYLEEIVSDGLRVKYSYYKLIYTYDEFLELAENALSIDSRIFEENVVLYIKHEFPHIGGESIGYSALTMIDGAPYITYQKYYYEGEMCSDAVIHYNDYLVIPKSEIPSEVYKSGKIGIIMKEIHLIKPHFSNKTELTELPINTATVLESREEMLEFKDTHSLENYIYPSYDNVALAVYVNRPLWDNESEAYQGYYWVCEESTLKIYYFYDGNNIGKMDTCVDFISIPKSVVDKIDSVEIEVKPRLEPAIKHDDSID